MSLPDINTENDFVKSYIDQWGKQMIANYSSKTPGHLTMGIAKSSS